MAAKPCENDPHQPEVDQPKSQMDPHRRYLRCTAAVTVAHLKKLIRMKYELPPLYQVEIIHQKDVLCDDYTLVDVAYIYSWRRNGPMRFYYYIRQQDPNPPKRQKTCNDVVKIDIAGHDLPDSVPVDVAVAPMEVEVTTCVVPFITPHPTATSAPQLQQVSAPSGGIKRVEMEAIGKVSNVDTMVVKQVPVVTSSAPPPIRPVTPLVVSVRTLTAKIPLGPKEKSDKDRTVTIKEKMPEKVESLMRVSKDLVVTMTTKPISSKSSMNGTSTVTPPKINGVATREERSALLSNFPVVTSAQKDGGDHELLPTVVSIGTKERPVTDVTKDSVVVVMVASKEPPEIPVTNGTANNHVNGGISPSPPLQLPVPDISITPIPPSSLTSQQQSEAVQRPRDALLATNPQVEIIKKVTPIVTVATSAESNSVATVTAVTSPVVTTSTTVTVPAVPAVATTTTTITSTAAPATTVVPPVTTSVTIPVTTTTAPSVVPVTSATTIITTSCSDTTTTITITSSPAEEAPSTAMNETEDTEEPPKHDNIGALDLSKNSRTGQSRPTPPQTPSPMSMPSPSRSTPPTFPVPSLMRIPTQAHVHSVPKTSPPSTTTVHPPPPPPLPFLAHSRSVPPALSAAAARPLFMASRSMHRPMMALQASPMKCSSRGGMNGMIPRPYIPHHHHGHHHHSSGHHHVGHQGRGTAPKHLLSAIGMLAVKKPDYHHRMVTDKPGLGKFHNGGKVDTTSSSV